MSGTIVVRCPVDLHADLVAEAERQGVSLNNLCVSLLAGGIHFKLPKRKKP
jgi:predicted HicB family RNase H-like nuclease